MDYNKIELLLHKYFEGATTLAEEEKLNVFFTNTEEIPESLLYAKDIFNYRKEEKSSKYARVLKPRKRIIKRSHYYLSGIAASLLLGLILTLSNIKAENKIIFQSAQPF